MAPLPGCQRIFHMTVLPERAALVMMVVLRWVNPALTFKPLASAMFVMARMPGYPPVLTTTVRRVHAAVAIMERRLPGNTMPILQLQESVKFAIQRQPGCLQPSIIIHQAVFATVATMV